jgi:phosphatidylserine/phosphatidylglycerophosphate/cardiolipin synthase-like enzyme
MRTPKRRLGKRLREPFAATSGNSFAAADDGPMYFDTMLDAIADARSSVDVEMYLWDDDHVGRRFVDALGAAASRGVRVRVLIDAVGSADVEGPLGAVDDAGGDIRVFNPLRFRFRFLRGYFHRTHKKLLICDEAVAFTGGAGFSKWWSGGKRLEQEWHDRMFRVAGPVVRDLVKVFESDHGRWPARRELREPRAPDPTVDLAPAGTAELRVLRGWPDGRDFRKTLVAQIHGARERVWIGTPYFVPPLSLVRALTGALQRGVHVELVLPSSNYAHPLMWHASRRYYRWFMSRGARFHEYAPGFYHAKLAVIDGVAAIVGSSNLDSWSWNRNAEIDLIATDADSVALVAGCFEADRARSRLVTRSDVGMRSLWARTTDRFAGWIEKWL